MVSTVVGLLIFLVDGLIVNHLFAVTGIDETCNSMYLQEPPFESMPWLTTGFMGIAGITVAFLLAVGFEKLVLKKKWKEIFTLSNILGDDIIKPKSTPSEE